MTPIALLRHHPTDWNREGRFQGRVDRPLTDAARDELSRLAPPARWRDARVLASPLSRARDTAEALWGRAGTDPRLVELAWGAWEGRLGRELLDDPASGFEAVERWGWNRRPPGGESPADARARVAPLLGEIARDGRRCVLVAHRGLIRVILAMAWGWDFDRPEPFRIRAGVLAPLALDPSGRPCAPQPPEPLVAR